MKQNTRIASRNYVGSTIGMSRASAQSNLFGQKTSNHMQTRSQTSMLTAEPSKPYLNHLQTSDFRGSPKCNVALKQVAKKGSKVKISEQHKSMNQHHQVGGHSQGVGHGQHHTTSMHTTGGVSARSNNLHHTVLEEPPNYSTKTFYSNYIGANSQKGTATNSQAGSFVKKSRNNSYSTLKNNAEAGNKVKKPEMKVSQTQSQMATMSGTNIGSGGAFQHQSALTVSNSRLLSSLQDRFLNDGKSNKAAAAAMAAARVNANIQAAASQNIQKLAVPDLASKLMKTQMSLDLKGLSKIAQQQKSRATNSNTKVQKSNRAMIPQNKVSIVLNNNQWEQVQHVKEQPRNEYSLRSISRKRDTKGVNKQKTTTREVSLNNASLDDKNDTIRTKKLAASSIKTTATKRKGIQNELLASLNLKNYQKGILTQQLSSQNSTRAIVSPKNGPNSSFKFNSGNVSNMEGLTPKQTTKAYQRVTRQKTSKLRGSLIQQPEHINTSYNQYGITDGTQTSLGQNMGLNGVPGGAHTGYLTSIGYNSPDFNSPLAAGNQSSLNIRHNRVQSNIVESMNSRAASQSALGLVSNNLGSTQQPISKQATGRLAAKSKKTVLNQQQMIQEKIRQLAMKDFTESQGILPAKEKTANHDRNVMSVFNQLNKRLDNASNQATTMGQNSKKLSSRASIHKSANQVQEMGGNASSQKVLQEKLIKKAQEKLGGKSLNTNQIQASKTTKDLASVLHHQSPGQQQQNLSFSTLTTAKRRSETKNKKSGESTGTDGQAPLTQIELVGVYKYTRQQRTKKNSDQLPTLSPQVPEKQSRNKNSNSRQGQQYNTVQQARESENRPISQMKSRIDKAYKQYCDNAELHNNSRNSLVGGTGAGGVVAKPQQAPKAKGSSKLQKEKALQAAKLAAEEAAKQQEQESILRKRVGKSASVQRKRQDTLHSQQALLQAASRHKYKEDQLSASDTQEPDDEVAELGLVDQIEIQYSKRKRREVSEPPRYYQSLQTQKLFKEADLLVLEDRSNSRVRSFKIFDDKRVFPEIYEKEEFQPIDNEEKHDECDYDTEPEHVVKARELMLEDLTESIKFYVEEQPLDLVYNIHKKYK